MLSDREFFRVVDFVLRLPGRWWIRRSENLSGGGAMVLATAAGSDMAAQKFRLLRHESGICVEVRHGGRRSKLVFQTIDDALNCILDLASRTHPPREPTCLLES